MKVLVIGRKGQLGKCLHDQFSQSSDNIFFSSRREIDVSDIGKTRKKITRLNPSVVVNASAYTAVDLAEENIESANIVNHIAVENLASICADINCTLLHVSTDYVFDGKSRTPYNELADPNPIGVYGSSKLKGELAIIKSNCKSIIVRSSGIFSEYGSNFMKKILDLGRKHDELSLVHDQIVAPTYAHDLANAIYKILSSRILNEETEIYHYAGNKSCSWFEFANRIFEAAENKGFIKKKPQLHAIRSKDFQTLASILCFGFIII